MKHEEGLPYPVGAVLAQLLLSLQQRGDGVLIQQWPQVLARLLDEPAMHIESSGEEVEGGLEAHSHCKMLEHVLCGLGSQRNHNHACKTEHDRATCQAIFRVHGSGSARQARHAVCLGYCDGLMMMVIM